jgi:hypothetical protein
MRFCRSLDKSEVMKKLIPMSVVLKMVTRKAWNGADISSYVTLSIQTLNQKIAELVRLPRKISSKLSNPLSRPTCATSAEFRHLSFTNLPPSKCLTSSKLQITHISSGFDRCHFEYNSAVSRAEQHTITDSSLALHFISPNLTIPASSKPSISSPANANATAPPRPRRQNRHPPAKPAAA